MRYMVNSPFGVVRVVALKGERGAGVEDVRREVAALKGAVGSPLVATTAAGMTDKTKVYVYTGSESGYTSGHWYYWNGSAWTDGGVYNSVAVNTDTTLSVSGMAADAAAVGTRVDSTYTAGAAISLSYTSGGYINNNTGEVVSYPGWDYTDFVDISATSAQRIYVSTTAAGSFNYNAFYAADHTFILGFSSNAGFVTVPYGAKYVRMSKQSSATQTLSLCYVGLRGAAASDLQNASPTFRGNIYGANWSRTFANLAGKGNIFTNLAASQWDDIPFGGAAISTQYGTGYDLQVIFKITGNGFAYRFVSRSTQEPYGDGWAYTDLAGVMSDISDLQSTVLTTYGGTLPGSNYSRMFANVAGTANIICNLAGSQWDDIPFGGAAINYQYAGNYDLQVIYKIEGNATAYRFVNRTTKEPYMEWCVTDSESPLNGKKIAIIGDSRSSYEGTVPSGNACYYPRSSGSVLTELDQMWWKIVADYFGMTLTINDSYSGGFVANEDGGDGANILSSDTAVNNLGSTAPDLILIFAGVNDWNNNQVAIGTYDGTGEFPSNNTTFREAYAIMLSKIQKKFPSADIWLCTNPYCCPAGTGSTISNMAVPTAGSGGTSLDAFNDAIRDMAGVFGCGIIEFTQCGVNWGNLKTYAKDYSTDNGLHYNAAGDALLAKVAIRTLKGYYNA